MSPTEEPILKCLVNHLNEANIKSDSEKKKKTYITAHVILYGRLNKMISKNYLTSPVYTSWNIYICRGTCRLFTLKSEKIKTVRTKSEFKK